MKRLMVIMAAVFLLMTFSMVNAKDYEISKKSGDYNVQVKIDKNPPVTGKNKMEVFIKDNAGKDVIDAAVNVEYGMPCLVRQVFIRFCVAISFPEIIKYSGDLLYDFCK